MIGKVRGEVTGARSYFFKEPEKMHWSEVAEQAAMKAD